VVKATDTKSSAKPAHGQQGHQPFFNKEGGNALLSNESAEKEAPAPFFVQRKLTIGKPDDQFEKEADSVADQVVQRMSQPAAEQAVQAQPAAAPAPQSISPIPTAPAAPAAQQDQLQKKEESEGKEEEEIVQRKPIFDSMADPPEDRVQRKPIFDSMADPQEERVQRKENNAAPEPAHDGLQQRLESSKGGGQPLPAETRTAMESSMGADFSGVRIHTGHQAASLSNELGAQAFTHGNDIYFNEGKYDPSGKSGQHLLAHELTHTVQQGASIQRKPDTSVAPPDIIQKSGSSAPAPSKGPSAAASGEVVNIASGNFLPSQKLKDKIREAGDKGLEVNVSAGAVAGAGTMKVYEKDGEYFSRGTGYLPLKLGILQPANPMLAVQMKDGKVSGFGTVGRSASKNSIPQWLRNDGKALSWLNGIDVKNAPQATNSFENGNFNFWLNGVKVKVSKFADATLNFGVTNMKPVANVSVDLDIKGMAKGNLNLTLKDNVMFGEGSFDVQFKNFKGVIAARFAEGMLDVKGTVGYDGNKLSGSLTLIMTDKATADNLAKDTVKAAGGDVKEAAPPAAIPAAGDKAGPRALAGVGALTFNLTEWFAGSVNVIVDGEGEVTVIGKIAPPKEIILFEQKDYSKELFKLEARAAYGLPVIGNVFVFANMALIALAKVGPAKIYNIEVQGTYSTRADVAKSITLAGSLNISAYAGLRLRAEGGAGLEIVDHDVKVGVGVNADAGVKGYIDARPTIGYRDPGEFFFKGHMEIAAQPFLGLSGDLFAEVDSPWWSPLPDKKWTWPIGSLEYALPGEFGIGADMEYVLGSGKVPEIKFGEAQFDGQKFMTDLVDDHVPKKGGAGKGDKQGRFVDGGAGGAAPAADGKGATGKGPGGKGDAPKGAAPKPAGGKGGGKDKKGKGEEKIEDTKNFADAMKAVKSLEQRTKPMTRDEINTAVDSIKKRFKVQAISVTPQGTDWWIITGSIKGKPNKQSAKVKASMKPGDDKEPKGKDKEKQKQLDAGINALKAEDKRVAGDGKMDQKEAEKVAGNVASSHKDTFRSISVKEIDGHWKYHYIQRTAGHVTGAATTPSLPPGVKIGDTVYMIKQDVHGTIEGIADIAGTFRVRVKDLKNSRKNTTWILIPLAEFKQGIAFEKAGDPKVLYQLKGPIKWDATRTKFEYETVMGRKFTGEIDANDKVRKIIGHKLTLKPPHIIGRGTTQDPADKKKNAGMETAHFIADEFGGPGFVRTYNVGVTSATYNDPHMRGVEKEIKAVFKRLKAVAMDIEVNITWGLLTDKAVADAIVAKAKAAPNVDPGAIQQLEASIKQQIGKINSKDMNRVIRTEYTVTYFDVNTQVIDTTNHFLGPDIYYES
jgi:hypothetical protein